MIWDDVSVCFLHFRVDISDTLMYVYEMLGAELLSNLYERLGRQLMDPQLSAVWQVTIPVKRVKKDRINER